MIAVVVQPGVEFGDLGRLRVRPGPRVALKEFVRGPAALVYEAHSTDYQGEGALRALVEDHFAILKVGPG